MHTSDARIRGLVNFLDQINNDAWMDPSVGLDDHVLAGQARVVLTVGDLRGAHCAILEGKESAAKAAIEIYCSKNQLASLQSRIKGLDEKNKELQRKLDSLEQPQKKQRDKKPESDLGDVLVWLRDVFPVPNPGTILEGLWTQAMGDASCIPAYVKACITSKESHVEMAKISVTEVIETLKGFRPKEHMGTSFFALSDTKAEEVLQHLDGAVKAMELACPTK